MTILTADGFVEYIRAGDLGTVLHGFSGAISVCAPDGKIYWLTDYVYEPPVRGASVLHPASVVPEPKPLIRIDGSQGGISPARGRGSTRGYGRGMRTSFRVEANAPIPIIRHRKEDK